MKSRENTLLVALLMGGFGCAGAPKQVTAPVVEAEDEVPEDQKVVLPDGVEGRDINGDGKPDIFKHYKTVAGKQVIVKREADLNADGTIDTVRQYNVKGEPIEEEMDLDFDGKKDVKRFYEAGKLVREEFDLNYDGSADLSKFYEAGMLIRKEQDSKLTGKVDLWEYYDEKGKLERIGVDHDGDGEIDAWQNAEEGGVIADAQVAGAKNAAGKDSVDVALEREKASEEEAKAAAAKEAKASDKDGK
jgi:hypothetical protein